MTFDLQSVKEILNLGLGVASFAAFVFGAYKIALWGDALLNNHLTHLQESMDSMNEMLVKISTILDDRLPPKT